MSNKAATEMHRPAIGLENADAEREVTRIAVAVANQTMGTVVMKEECAKVADMHYVTVKQVYGEVFAKAKVELGHQLAHRAKESEAFKELRNLAK